MAIKFISIKCPECGASLEIEDGRKQAFCTYCGAKVLIYNENHHEYTYRTIDEASLLQANVRLKELEYEEKKRKSKVRWTIFLFLFSFLTGGLAYLLHNDIMGYICFIFVIITLWAMIFMWDNNNKNDK